jgi:hypothetical protein
MFHADLTHLRRLKGNFCADLQNLREKQSNFQI